MFLTSDAVAIKRTHIKPPFWLIHGDLAFVLYSVVILLSVYRVVVSILQSIRGNYICQRVLATSVSTKEWVTTVHGAAQCSVHCYKLLHLLWINYNFYNPTFINFLSFSRIKWRMKQKYLHVLFESCLIIHPKNYTSLGTCHLE